MASAAELLILLKAQDHASKVMDGVGQKAGGMGGMIAAGLAVGATAAVAAGVALFKMGSDFDAAYDSIRIGTGATGETLEGLKNDMKSVLAEVPASMQGASTAIADLNTRLGLTGEPLQTMSKQMLELSRITKTDVAQNIRDATRVFGDWDVAAKDQAATMDLLFRTSQATGITIGELQAKVVQFGAPLRAMGFSLSESAAMLGKWEKEGVNTELVLGSLRIAMGQFARDNVPMREGLNQTVAEIQRLGPSAAATALAMEVFGARAGPDMAAAILEGRFAFGDLLAAIEGGEDTIMGVGKETMDAAEKFDILKNRAMNLIEPLASGLFEAVNDLADLFLDAGPKIEAFAAQFQPLIDLVKGFAGGTAELPGPLADFTAMIDEHVLPVIRELWQNIQDFLADIQVLWGPAFATIQGWARSFFDTIKEWWDRHGKDIMSIVQGLWMAVQGIFQVAFSIIGGLIKIFLSLLGGDFEGAGKHLEEMWEGVWEGVQKIFSGGLQAVWGILKTAITTMGELGSRIGNALKDAILGALGGLAGGIGNAIGGAVGNIPGVGGILGAGGQGTSMSGRGVSALSPASVTSVNIENVHLRDRTEIAWFDAELTARIGKRSNLSARFGSVA